MYNTKDGNLFQSRPRRRTRSYAHKEHGWYTRDGYLYMSDKIARCIEWAHKHYFTSEFTKFVSVNFVDDIEPAIIGKYWTKVTDYLQKNGVVAWWVVETTRRSDHFNFHLLLRSDTPNIYDLLKHKTRDVRTNIRVEPYNCREGRWLFRYMTKAKTPKWRDGELVSADRWARKRVIFKKEVKIHKYGVINKKAFWEEGKNKDKVWSEIQVQLEMVRENLQHPGADAYVKFIHDLICGYYSLKAVRWSVGISGVDERWWREQPA